MAIAWSRSSSKVMAHPPYAAGAYRRRCRNKPSCSRPCIPHIVDERKQEVWEAHDVEVTPFSQIRGGVCHVCLGRLHLAKTLMEHRSARCLHAHALLHITPKPASVVA